MLVQLGTGFSSGLPLLLTGGTLQAWMVDEEVALGEIGLFALVGLPYTLKFLWAPIFDRYVPPWLGRRRGWMLVVQTMLLGAIALLGTAEPARAPWVVALLALAVTFSSASQDIVLDAYRREILPEAELGLGSSIFVNGYRGAMLVSGALALFLADHLPWAWVYWLMATAMAVGLVTTLLCREPEVEARPPHSLREAVVGPFVEFFARKGAWYVLAFVLLYKIGDQMAAAMTTPFVLALGFTKTDVATVAKVFGMASTIAGGLVGGLLMVRLGIQRALWIFGVLQATSILGFALLAEVGKVWWLLATMVSWEALTMGMGSSAYVAYMASQTNQRFTATQYALLTSIMGVPRVLVAAPTGFLAAAFGWSSYFVFCALCAIPGMLLLLKIAPWRAADRP